LGLSTTRPLADRMLVPPLDAATETAVSLAPVAGEAEGFG
jgi:hypothetical protein